MHEHLIGIQVRRGIILHGYMGTWVPRNLGTYLGIYLGLLGRWVPSCSYSTYTSYLPAAPPAHFHANLGPRYQLIKPIFVHNNQMLLSSIYC